MTAKTYYLNREEQDDLEACPECGCKDFKSADRDYAHGCRTYYEYYECAGCGLEFTQVYEYKHTEYTKEAWR